MWKVSEIGDDYIFASEEADVYAIKEELKKESQCV